MGRLRALLHKRWSDLFGGFLFVLSVGIVFGQVLPRYAGLIAPDSMPFFGYAHRTATVEGLLTGQSFTPHTLYWLLFDPLIAHELTYIMDSFVLVLGGVYYLRSQRVHPLAAWFGGLALGLSGYTFTLFSAGHRGYFHMFSCAVWAFGLIAHGFETRRLIYFALLGLVFAWGVPYQPDVLLLIGALAAAYALWRTFKEPAARGDGLGVEGQRSSGFLSVMLHVWPRFAVALAVLVLAGFGGLRAAVTTQIAGRDAQIAGASGKPEKADVQKGEKTDEERRTRWLFATNWSLPPEDMLEFIVPGVFGNDSAQPPYPYWGRLGRPDSSVFQKGRMMPNYRQHTVYLGVVSVLFAFFGIVAYFCDRKTKRAASLQPTSALCPLSSVLHPLRSPSSAYTDIPFWCAAWLVCLVLAMGRYTPFYRLFYAIPYMDYIRAPVKFLHLTEIATAFLAGFGMNVFLRTEQAAQRRKLLWLAVGLTILLLVGLLVTVVARPSMVRHITELGMGQAAEILSGYALRNFARAAGLAAIVATLAYAVTRKAGERLRVWVCCGLVAAMMLDQALVACRYVRVMNVEPLYAENAVVKAIKKQAGGKIANVVNYASPNTGQDWFSMALTFNGIRNLMPSQDEQDTPYGLLFAGLQKDTVRLWQVLNAQFVIVPRKAIEGLLRQGVLQSVMDFELAQGVVRRTTQPGEKTLTLACVRAAIKGPRWVVDWQGAVPVDKQTEAATSGKQTVSDAPPPAAAVMPDTAEVAVLAAHGEPGVVATRVKVSAKMPGLLVFDEKNTGQQEILLDGKPAPLYTVDGIWSAAVVPVGSHQVVLRQQRKPTVFLLSVLTTLALVLWSAVGLLSKARSPDAGAVA